MNKVDECVGIQNQSMKIIAWLIVENLSTHDRLAVLSFNLMTDEFGVN